MILPCDDVDIHSANVGWQRSYFYTLYKEFAIGAVPRLAKILTIASPGPLPCVLWLAKAKKKKRQERFQPFLPKNFNAILSVRIVSIDAFVSVLFPHFLHELHPHFFHGKIRSGPAFKYRFLFALIVRVKGIIMHFLPGIKYVNRQDVA
jgi:hypothetical protein